MICFLLINTINNNNNDNNNNNNKLLHLEKKMCTYSEPELKLFEISSILRDANLANFLDQLTFSEEFNLDKK